MTTIQLMTADQSLIAVGKVKLASGDVDSVQIEVDFDSVWDEFINRTATFHTSKDATVYEMLMIDNKCIIPAEVLAESCTLFIGVRGVPADGSAVKTSSLAKYKVVEGAEPGHTTIKPAMDLYRQYLASINEKIAPELTAMREEFEAIKSDFADVYENKLSKYAKACDYSRKLTTITQSTTATEEWTATEDCWIGVSIQSQTNQSSLSVSVDDFVVQTITAQSPTSSSTYNETGSLFFVKAGSVVKFNATMSNSGVATSTVFGCLE